MKAAPAGSRSYAFCLSDKDIVGIVQWNLVKKGPTLATPTARLLHGEDWWNKLYLGRRILTGKGYNADLYLPTGCMK